MKLTIRPLVYFLPVFLLGTGVYYWQHSYQVKKFSTKHLPQVHIRSANYPQWESYAKIGEEFSKLKEKWSTEQPANQNNWYTAISKQYSKELLAQEASQVNQLYQAESVSKLAKLNQRLQEFRTEQLTKINAAYQLKATELNQALDEELQKQREQIAVNHKIYCNNLDNKEQLRLTNLQLQLAMINDYAKTNQDRERFRKIQLEMDLINEQLQKLKNEELARLTTEFDNYEKKRRLETAELLEQIQLTQVESFSQSFLTYKQKLELEFDCWLQLRQQEFQQITSKH